VSLRTVQLGPEYRDEAVQMVLESSRPIAHVARELGLNEGTLGNWVNKYRKEHGSGKEPELGLDERAELRRLRDEVRELRMKNEFLGKAAAFFAQEYR
jgi:transposase